MLWPLCSSAAGIQIRPAPARMRKHMHAHACTCTRQARFSPLADAACCTSNDDAPTPNKQIDYALIAHGWTATAEVRNMRKRACSPVCHARNCMCVSMALCVCMFARQCKPRKSRIEDSREYWRVWSLSGQRTFSTNITRDFASLLMISLRFVQTENLQS